MYQNDQGRTIQGGKPRVSPQMSSVSQIPGYIFGAGKREAKTRKQTSFQEK